MDGAADAWWDRELAGCRFSDERRGKRLRKLVEQMDLAMGASIPLAGIAKLTDHGTCLSRTVERAGDQNIIWTHVSCRQILKLFARARR
jgi:Transposase DNA-binding